MSKPTQRTTKARTNSRRSHHALKGQRLRVCDACGQLTKPHHACPVCGEYKGRKVMNTQKRIDRRAKKLKALS